MRGWCFLKKCSCPVNLWDPTFGLGFHWFFGGFLKKPSLFFNQNHSFKPFRLENAKVHFSLHLPIAGRLLGGSCEQCCALHCWNGSNGGSQVSRSLPGNRPKGTMGTGQWGNFVGMTGWLGWAPTKPHKILKKGTLKDSQVFRFGMQGLCDWNVWSKNGASWCITMSRLFMSTISWHSHNSQVTWMYVSEPSGFSCVFSRVSKFTWPCSKSTSPC